MRNYTHTNRYIVRMTFIMGICLLLISSCQSLVKDKPQISSSHKPDKISNADTPLVNHDTTNHDMLSGDHNSFIVYRDRTFQTYADSLNWFKNGDRLPFFLENYYIDNGSKFWDDLHHPISVRKSIIDKVMNIEALDAVLKSDNPNYDVKPSERDISNNIIIPYYNYSLRQLVFQRKQELMK